MVSANGSIGYECWLLLSFNLLFFVRKLYVERYFVFLSHPICSIDVHAICLICLHFLLIGTEIVLGKILDTVQCVDFHHSWSIINFVLAKIQRILRTRKVWCKPKSTSCIFIFFEDAFWAGPGANVSVLWTIETIFIFATICILKVSSIILWLIFFLGNGINTNSINKSHVGVILLAVRYWIDGCIFVCTNILATFL